MYGALAGSVMAIVAALTFFELLPETKAKATAKYTELQAADERIAAGVVNNSRAINLQEQNQVQGRSYQNQDRQDQLREQGKPVTQNLKDEARFLENEMKRLIREYEKLE